MKTRLLIDLGLVVLVAALFWATREVARESTSTPAALPDNPSAASSIGQPETAALPEGLKEDLSSDYLQGYGTAASDAMRDVMLVQSVLDAFTYTVKVPDALPAGSNQELVQALTGRNPHGIRFLDPRAPFLNQAGEIADRWQTPLFFHFENARDPAIRSAGPDRKMWTADDVVTPD